MESVFASGAIGAILVAVAAIFRERNMRRKHKTERYQSDFQIGQRLRDELRAEMDSKKKSKSSPKPAAKKRKHPPPGILN